MIIGVCVWIEVAFAFLFLQVFPGSIIQRCSVVALRIELSALSLSERDEQPALDDRFPLLFQCASRSSPSPSRAPRSRTGTLLHPKQACFLLHLYPIFVRHCFRDAADWEALESSSPGLQPGAKPSQLPVQFVCLSSRAFRLDRTTKKARCRVTPGCCYSHCQPCVTSEADRETNYRSRRYCRSICI